MTSSSSRDTFTVCEWSAIPLRDKARLWGVWSGKTGAGWVSVWKLQGVSYAPSVSLTFSALCCGAQARRLITLPYPPAEQRTSRRTPSTPLIFSAGWSRSLMQVFQWNLYNPDVNPVASPSGLDMSGNEHYWADKISEHFFHRKPTDFHLRVWHARSLRLLERHTLDCLWQDMNRKAQADMKSQAGDGS